MLAALAAAMHATGGHTPQEVTRHRRSHATGGPRHRRSTPQEVTRHRRSHATGGPHAMHAACNACIHRHPAGHASGSPYQKH
jgi:hypothetical protein